MGRFNLNRKSVPGELEILQGFITRNYNVNNIRYANNTMVIADTESK